MSLQLLRSGVGVVQLEKLDFGDGQDRGLGIIFKKKKLNY